jgi:hypothetical protein
MWGSNSSGDFNDLVYANNGSWVRLTTSVSEFDRHVGADIEDPKYFTVINSTAYRYYAFKFGDTWGEPFMGLRRLVLQTVYPIAAPDSITLSVGDSNPVGGVTNVTMPAAGGIGFTLSKGGASFKPALAKANISE